MRRFLCLNIDNKIPIAVFRKFISHTVFQQQLICGLAMQYLINLHFSIKQSLFSLATKNKEFYRDNFSPFSIPPSPLGLGLTMQYLFI